MQWIEKIVRPVAKEIVEAWAQDTGRIVLVIYNPNDTTIQAFEKMGLRLTGGTTVAAMQQSDAATVWQDAVTKRWLAKPTTDEAIKVLLVSGGGTALLTFRFADDTVHVFAEPNLRLVPEES